MTDPLIDMLFEKRDQFGMKGSDLLVLVRLASHRGRVNDNFPSIPVLVKELGVSKRTIKNSIKFLQEKSLLSKVSDFSCKDNSPNIYRINVEAFCAPGKESV